MLVINEKGNNYFKLLPDDTIDYPKEEKEQILWGQKIYKDLKNNPGTKILFNKDNVKKGHKICVCSLDNTTYLFQTIRIQSRVYTVSVYMSKLETAPNDYVAIAKMLTNNLCQIGKNYKQQIKDGVKYFEKGEIPPEDRKELPVNINSQLPN